MAEPPGKGRLGVGMGWRPEIDLTVERMPGVDFVEVIAENIRPDELPESLRVLLARALAQRTPVLVLDEPTNHLDVRHQFDLLDLVTSAKTTVVAALHDLNLAAAYCDHVYVLAEGRVVADGPPYEVLTPRLVREVFGVDAHVVSAPGSDAPHLVLRPAD
ncbi:hypothetical protein ACFQ08_45155, partial [Streptosporangium algeriense]